MNKTYISLLHEIIDGRKYFSVNAVKFTAQSKKYLLNSVTTNQYLANLKKRNDLYSAGRGWYSTIAHEYQLDTLPVIDLLNKIQRRFPLLSFSIWSTKQLQPFAHHLMMRFVTFVFAGRDALPSIADFLNDEGERSILNPPKNEVEKFFNASPYSIVLRPTITREPVDGNCATIEKILIDLFMEKDRLLLMDGAEYQKIFRNLIFSHRIRIGRLLEYAERRKVEAKFLKIVMEPEKESILFEHSVTR